MNRLKRNKSGKKTSRAYYECLVDFLEDVEPLEVIIQKDTLGSWLMDKVFHHLDIIETDYFGLRYLDKDGQRQWLESQKSVSRQLGHANPMRFSFRIKFYPEVITVMVEEITRYQLFLQVRRDLLHGRLYCLHASDACTMAALVIQSEIGDFNSNLPDDYVTHFRIFPRSTTNEMNKRIMKVHKGLEGDPPSEAEWKFMEKAAMMDTYGVDPYPIRESKEYGSGAAQLYMAANHAGVSVFQSSNRIHLFRWQQINKVGYEGKMIVLNITIDNKKRVSGFKCLSYGECKALWKHIVEQRAFFTLTHKSGAQPVSSRVSFFSRGSKFRFSGRSQAEAINESRLIRRESPSFQRSYSNPHLINLSRPSSQSSDTSLGSATSMPPGQLTGAVDSKNLFELAKMLNTEQRGDLINHRSQLAEVESNIPRAIKEADEEEAEKPVFRPIIAEEKTMQSHPVVHPQSKHIDPPQASPEATTSPQNFGPLTPEANVASQRPKYLNVYKEHTPVSTESKKTSISSNSPYTRPVDENRPIVVPYGNISSISKEGSQLTPPLKRGTLTKDISIDSAYSSTKDTLLDQVTSNHGNVDIVEKTESNMPTLTKIQNEDFQSHRRMKSDPYINRLDKQYAERKIEFNSKYNRFQQQAYEENTNAYIEASTNGSDYNNGDISEKGEMGNEMLLDEIDEDMNGAQESFGESTTTPDSAMKERATEKSVAEPSVTDLNNNSRYRKFLDVSEVDESASMAIFKGFLGAIIILAILIIILMQLHLWDATLFEVKVYQPTKQMLDEGLIKFFQNIFS